MKKFMEDNKNEDNVVLFIDKPYNHKGYCRKK